MNGDFGQIDIYNSYYPYSETATTLKTSPSECIARRQSYAVTINGKYIPIMMGSDIHLNNHADDNPVNVVGYFIIEGICKTIYNIKVNYIYPVKVDMAVLPDNTELHIDEMGKYYTCSRYDVDGKHTPWKLPFNYIDIKNYCSEKWRKPIMTHLTFVKSNFGICDNICKDELYLHILAELFEAWLSRKTKYVQRWRIRTAGETINNTLVMNASPTCVIDFMKTNTWTVNNDTFTLSENMDHNNFISDLESIRRVTYMAHRERLPSESRCVQINDKYLLCPVQYPSGTKAGAVLYLTRDAKVLTRDDDSDSSYAIAFVNGMWKKNIKINYGYRKLLYTIKTDSDDGTYNTCSTDVYICSSNIGLPVSSESSSILSECATLIPYYNHNPAIRATFACSMIKQAISSPNHARKIHLLTGGRVLNKGNAGNTGSREMRHEIYGNNLLVGIMCWYKWNVEDAIVISESCARKFDSTIYKIYIRNNFILLSDVKPVNSTILNKSLLAMGLVDGVLEKITANLNNHDGHIDCFDYSIETQTLFIRVRYLNLVEVGDKFASRHGQKGVISKIEPDDNMPYVINNGRKHVLDLLLNPHAFPTRMTMGQLKEMGNSEQYVYIPSANLSTGDIKTMHKVLVGQCYYMALKHQVNFKVQHRFNGLTDIVTNQPKRNDVEEMKDGGLRLGTMEHYVLFATKQLQLLKEFRDADRCSCLICTVCGTILNAVSTYKCCNEMTVATKMVNKSLLIVVSLLRSLYLDLKWKIDENKYKICILDKNMIETTATLYFGYNNVLDLKQMNDIIYLPICLRSLELEKLYHLKSTTKSDLHKKHKKLLCGKSGMYHRLFEGHRLNRSLRSVIVPDPTLEIDTVLIPKNSYIGCIYGILNRQPSLDITSMRIVKLVQGNTNCIHINPLICALFNADFDGDEMNIYGIQKSDNILKAQEALPTYPIETQDYIYSKYYNIASCEVYGLTATKEHILSMISAGSKGNLTNYRLLYEKLGDIYVNKAVFLHCNENYSGGISDDNWYVQAMSSREAAVSIAVNTPYTGSLYEKAMDTLL